ncbi:MAG: ABC-type branched-chain amino acid transport system, permease component [Anaerocolumna sp.]|jgi:branched-chain amino acid transport system permease protein|nr:ABC-type branched-chain amino acid transport system, permease component [Anaerocolumna sp.]
MKHFIDTIKSTYGKYKVIVWIICSLLLLIFPALIPSNYVMGVVCRILFYATLAGSLNVINGYSGQMCIGHAGFFCIGAYIEAILATQYHINFWVLLLVGGIITAIIGGLIALPTLRMQGIYLSIITLGFSEVVRLIALNWTSVTGGAMGVKGIKSPTLLGFTLSSPKQYYYIFLVIGIVFIFVTNRIINSRTGSAWISIREDELAARSLGIEIKKYKILNFMYGAFWAGVMGAAYAPYTRYIDSTYFSLDEGFNILSMVIIGGQGTLIGPILGAAVVNSLTELLRSFSEWRMVAYAVLIIAMMWLRPQGLVGASDSVLAGDKMKKKKIKVLAKEEK